MNLTTLSLKESVMKRVKLSLLGLLLVICLSSCGQSKTEEMNHVELTSESNGKESKAPDDSVDTEIASETFFAVLSERK